MALKRTVTIERDQRPYRRMRMTRVYRNPKVETRYKNTLIQHAGTDESNTLINGLAAGDGTSDRSGRKALIKSISVRATSTSNPTGGTPLVRVVLYSPKVAGTQLTGLTGNSLAGPINNDQFWVMYDKVYVSPRGDDQQSGKQAINIDLRRMLTTEFSGTGGTDITRGDVYLYLSSDNLAGFIIGHTKVWFQDK